MERNALYESRLDFTEQFAVARLNYKPLLHARKRIGTTSFPTFVRILLMEFLEHLRDTVQPTTMQR